MLKVTINSPSDPEIAYKFITFPDGTQKIDFEGLGRPTFEGIEEFGAKITWIGYQGDEELVRLAFITRHLQDVFNAEVDLLMPYVPNARMDRVKSQSEVFTLKHFADFINSLNFRHITIFDPHSNVTPALFKHVSVWTPENDIRRAIELTNAKYLYFPDEGAYKRYGDYFEGAQKLIGHKVRDWRTGEIKGLEISGTEGQTFEEGHFAGCSVLMIDDIISYGGTLAYSADELFRLGFKHINAYASHTEKSVLNEDKGTLIWRLKHGVVENIYTTNSLIQTKNHFIHYVRNF